MLAARAVAWLAVASLAQVGCPAVYRHVELPEATSSVPPVSSVPIAVALPRLPISLDHPAERRYGEHLIDVLGGSGLFAEVDWADRIDDPQAIPLAVTYAGKPDEEIGPYLWMLGLGLIPWVVTVDNGIEFERLDRTEPAIDCRWPLTAVQGWAVLLLWPLPAWQFDPDDAAFRAAMRACLVRHFDVLSEPATALPAPE